MKPRNTSILILLCIWVLGFFPIPSSATGGSDPNNEVFEEMLRDAVSQKDHFLLARRMYPALENLNEENLGRAVAIVERYSDRIYREHAFDLLARYWARIDPEGALDYCLTKLSEAERHHPTSAALYSWAMDAPESAIAWAEKNTLGKYRRSVFQGAIIGWALVDLPAATEYVRTMPQGVDRKSSIQCIAKAQMHYGMEAFEGWLRSIEEPAERQLAIDWVAPRWGRFDPEMKAALRRLGDEIEVGYTDETDGADK